MPRRRKKKPSGAPVRFNLEMPAALYAWTAEHAKEKSCSMARLVIEGLERLREQNENKKRVEVFLETEGVRQV